MRLSLRLALFSIGLFFSGAAHAADCDDLLRASLPDVTIEAAKAIPAGPFEGDNGMAPSRAMMPSYCRVTGAIRPTSRSSIRFELWMPDVWNGRLQGVGNGGLAGSINYRGGLVEATQRGYAAVSTDTGHSGNAGDGRWARGEPEKIVDYGHRAIHLTTVTAKALIAAFYGRAPDHSYFVSCSNGGRQGLMEAQRYPEDYDGIIAGAPAYDFTGLMAGFAWNAEALWRHPETIIPPERTPLITAAVLRECDLKDGVADGLIADPRRCAFDPRVLQCRSVATHDCLTAAQVGALSRIYRGAHDHKGRRLYPGWAPGGEAGELPGLGWEGWMFSQQDQGSSQTGLLKAVLANFLDAGPAWKLEHLNYDRDVAVFRQRYAGVLDATSPDLSRFWSRGGKLIIFHGWSDAAIAPQSSIDYYDAVLGQMGKARTDAGLRLFMAPSVQHCFGGAGPNNFGGLTAPLREDPLHDLSASLVLWVEQGQAPERIIATRYDDFLLGTYQPDKARPVSTGLLCSYPKLAHWKGHGATDAAENFQCL